MSGLAKVTALAMIASVGCAHGYVERDQNKYRDDSRALMMTKAPAVKTCYDLALKGDPKASGTVVVHFKLQPETGLVTEPQLDGAATTAPATLSRCVLQAMDGLKLDPADANEGQATFTWDLKPRVTGGPAVAHPTGGPG